MRKDMLEAIIETCLSILVFCMFAFGIVMVIGWLLTAFVEFIFSLAV